jgi:hypothetical protein
MDIMCHRHQSLCLATVLTRVAAADNGNDVDTVDSPCRCDSIVKHLCYQIAEIPGRIPWEDLPRPSSCGPAKPTPVPLYSNSIKTCLNVKRPSSRGSRAKFMMATDCVGLCPGVHDMQGTVSTTVCPTLNCSTETLNRP